ncbi:type II toxin-antitoxin system RelE family toxin [Rahnella contaminans]|uniref:type II toxin-antitoxin system RelE family toxin n=1 Tax=Rahnella contaminans TaxID=2703882 RepID=UPI003C2C9DB0
MTRVEWTKHALKQLKSIPGNYQKAISEKISLLQRYPALVANLDIKKMAGGEGEFRMRVGDYRVIYRIENGEPVVITIQRIARRTSTTY